MGCSRPYTNRPPVSPPYGCTKAADYRRSPLAIHADLLTFHPYSILCISLSLPHLTKNIAKLLAFSPPGLLFHCLLSLGIYAFSLCRSSKPPTTSHTPPFSSPPPSPFRPLPTPDVPPKPSSPAPPGCPPEPGTEPDTLPAPPPRRQIPLDVIYSIMEHARPRTIPGEWRTSTAAFARLSLVSRSARDFVETHLYRHIILEDMGRYGEDPLKSGRKCCATLQSSPRLASLVKRCTIKYLLADDDGDPDVEHLARTLGVLPNLSYLTFDSSSLGPPLFGAILGLRGLVSLVLQCGELALSEGTLIPAAKLALQSLTMIDFTAPCDAVTALASSTNLRSLTIDSHSTAHILHLLRDGKPRPIERLHISPYKRSVLDLSAVLNLYHGLKELGLAQPDDSGDPIVIGDLQLERGSLPNLERFSGSSSLASAFIAGRPIKDASFDMHLAIEGSGSSPRHMWISPEREAARLSAVRALHASACQVRAVEFSVQNFTDGSLDEVPLDVEEIRITSIKDDQTKVSYACLNHGFSKRPNLKRIQCSTTKGNHNSSFNTFAAECERQRAAIEMWHQLCPGLELVIFLEWLEWRLDSNGRWVYYITKPHLAGQDVAFWGDHSMALERD